MNENPSGSNEQVACELQVDIAEAVDAGAEVTLRCAVGCTSAAERLGESIEIRDHAGAEVGRVELVRFDGEVNETEDLVVTAPTVPGEYTWSALLPSHETGGVLCEESRASFSFVVRPHATRIEVWDVPSAITSGDSFRVKVGMKCSAGCDQAGREFEVYDQEGAMLASGTMADEPWPGTKALYFADLSLVAPEETGIFRWEVRSPEQEHGLAHEAGLRSFGSNSVARPDHEVTVKAIDAGKQAPIKGMHVLLHPFRARTDEHGVARLSVPKGEYSLLVSGFRYLPFRTQIKVEEDVSVTAEVEWEPIPEKISG